MSDTIASVDLRSSNFDAILKICDTYGYNRAGAKTIAERFTKKGLDDKPWIIDAAEIVAFMCSSKAGATITLSSTLLNWIKDEEWPAISHNVLNYNAALAITSGRYISIAGAKGIYDIESDEIIKVIPDTWLECRIFNLKNIINANKQKG